VLFANAGGGEFASLRGHHRRALRTHLRHQRQRHLVYGPESAPADAGRRFNHHDRFYAASTGTAGFSVYAATKAAIRSFARNWVLDLKGTGIRVNVLAPGSTSTPGWHGLAASEEANSAMIRAVEAATPLGRLGNPEEIAAAALFLASDESSFVNGIELFADGGIAQV
jgi:NAD(P)-dependent dehydrogenase (short-subunit alcohol dehydrogenase family)